MTTETTKAEPKTKRHKLRFPWKDKHANWEWVATVPGTQFELEVSRTSQARLKDGVGAYSARVVWRRSAHDVHAMTATMGIATEHKAKQAAEEAFADVARQALAAFDGVLP